MKIRPTNRVIKKSKSQNQAGIVLVGNHLKPQQKLIYPPDNSVTFERWYYNTYLSTDERDRIYLPIQWTALYCNNNFGKCDRTYRHIQNFLNDLDRTKKYYTIVQYDDGIINDISHLDMKVFAMSGPRIDYALPLLCQPHGFKFANTKRDIFASFVGRITHPIRVRMIAELDGLPGYYISTKDHKLKDYCEILARSKYALCPRGYGQTSFRIQEAIQFGAIPVYISDQFIIPYFCDKFNSPDEIVRTGLHLFDPKWANSIAHFLNVIDVNYNEKISEQVKSKHLFTYAGCKQMILKNLENDNTKSV